MALGLFIKKKNLFLILTLIIISGTTHVVGIIFLFTILSGFIIDKLIKNYPKFIYLICVSTFIFILRFDFNNINYFIIKNFSLLPFPEHYLISGFKEFSEGKGISLISIIVLSSFSGVCYLLLLKAKEKRIEFIRIPLLSCIFIPIFAYLSQIITYAQYVRLMSPYLIFLMLASLELISKLKYYKFFIAQLSIYIFSVIYFFRNIIINGEFTNLTPYKSWLLP